LPKPKVSDLTHVVPENRTGDRMEPIEASQSFGGDSDPP
jgi:hypothetical protein